MEPQKYMTAEEWRQVVGIDARCIIEAGSHDGRDTEMLLQAFPYAVIHCFEPERRCRVRFKRRLGDHPRVVLYTEAISDNNGFTPWWASHGAMEETNLIGTLDPELEADWDASGSIMRPTGHDGYPFWLYFREEESVQTVTLDTWRAEHPEVNCVDLLWADIQGAELKMIRAGRQVVEMTRYAYLEVHDPTIADLGSSPSELYEGQPTFAELIGALPNWRCLGLYGTDSVLFRNDASGSCMFEESQCGELPVLRALLPDDPVVYVDVGVGDYANWNVTWPFYKAGGYGLLVEPRGEMLADYAEHRPRDRVCAYAASDHSGQDTLRLAGNGSSLRSDWAIDAIQTGELPVRLEPLSAILEQCPAIRDQCRLCSIDTEGTEANVLRGIDWSTFRPEVLIIEYLEFDRLKPGRDISDAWYEYVVGQGYQECCRSWLNIIFVREDVWPRWEAVRDTVPMPHQSLEETQRYVEEKYEE